jgi:hypothetical protein
MATGYERVYRALVEGQRTLEDIIGARTVPAEVTGRR